MREGDMERHDASSTSTVWPSKSQMSNLHPYTQYLDATDDPPGLESVLLSRAKGVLLWDHPWLFWETRRASQEIVPSNILFEATRGRAIAPRVAPLDSGRIVCKLGDRFKREPWESIDSTPTATMAWAFTSLSYGMIPPVRWSQSRSFTTTDWNTLCSMCTNYQLFVMYAAPLQYAQRMGDPITVYLSMLDREEGLDHWWGRPPLIQMRPLQ